MCTRILLTQQTQTLKLTFNSTLCAIHQNLPQSSFAVCHNELFFIFPLHCVIMQEKIKQHEMCYIYPGLTQLKVVHSSTAALRRRGFRPSEMVQVCNLNQSFHPTVFARVFKVCHRELCPDVIWNLIPDLNACVQKWSQTVFVL